MKITQLLNEMETPSSSTTNATNSAPKFGRSDKFLEEKEETVEECSSGGTGAGSVASVAAPMGGVKRRGQGSMFQGIQTSEKYPNSKAVKEGKNSELDSLYDQYDELDYDGNSESDKEKMRHIQQKIKDLKAKEKKVNESQINEVDPRNFDSDVDYYAARNAPAKPRYRGTSSPGVNQDDEAYFREIFRKKRLAAQQQEREQDHDRLATGTNEGLESGSDLKTWQVVIFNNYYAGKYSDYRGRYYYVLASSPEEAKQVVLDNADGILQELLAMKSHNGKKILPRGSAVRITPDRIGKIEDGTVAGRMSTAGYKKMFGPQGLMMVKLSGGAVQDIQGQEQPVDEASFDYTMKDMGNDYAGFPSNHSMKHKFLSRIQPEKQQLYKDKINNTHRFEDLINLFNVAKQRGDIIEQGASQGTMGLNASLEQHADDKMKELGHKFKPVAEGSEEQWVVTVGTKTGGTSHTMTFSGTKEQAIKKAVARFGTSKNPVVTAKPKQQGVAEGLAQGNYNVGLEDIGKPVTVDGESGYVLLSIGYQSGNGKLIAHALQPNTGSKGYYALETVGKDKQGVAEGYPKHQDLSGISTERLKAYVAKVSGGGVPAFGAGAQLKRVQQELQRRQQGVAEDESQPVKYRATVEYGPTSADAHFVTVTANSTEEAEAKVEAWCKKKGVRNPMITINGADKPVAEEKQRLDPKCWSGYKKQGTKMKGDTRVNNCVKVDEAEVSEDKLASDLYRDLQIFKKGTDKDIGSKAKDKEISGKAKDKDIVVKEGEKVDRMVGHVKSSEKKLGHSNKEAENIAWATANKRGMLNNRNKK